MHWMFISSNLTRGSHEDDMSTSLGSSNIVTPRQYSNITSQYVNFARPLVLYDPTCYLSLSLIYQNVAWIIDVHLMLHVDNLMIYTFVPEHTYHNLKKKKKKFFNTQKFKK